MPDRWLRHRQDFPTQARLTLRGAFDADAMVTDRIALDDILPLAGRWPWRPSDQEELSDDR